MNGFSAQDDCHHAKGAVVFLIAEILEHQKYPEPPEPLRRLSLQSLWIFFGPGAVVACVTIGSGETVFASRGGAIFGYALLWCFVLSALVKGIQVYSGARFMVLTGAHPLESWSRMPGPRNWLVWSMVLLTVVWMPFYLGGGLPRMLGDFMNSLFAGGNSVGVGQEELMGRIWGTIFILCAIALTLVQRYSFLERVQTVMVVILLGCMLVAAVTCHPNLDAILSGLLIPRIPNYDVWVQEIPSIAQRDRFVEVIVYLGAIGGGTQDYFGYLGMMREKGWGMLQRPKIGSFEGTRIDASDENCSNGKQWLRAPLIDTGTSFAAMLVFTLCFAVLGAAVLNPQHRVPEGNELLINQASFLVRSDQPAPVQTLLVWIYRTGVFFAIFGTIYGAYELYTRTMRECLAAAIPKLRDVSLSRFRVATVLWCGVPGLLLLWLTTKDPVAILTPAAIVSSTLACGVWCFAMLWSDKQQLPEALRMGIVLRLGVALSGGVLCVLGFAALYKQYLD